ncbi:MFS transporter [Streptomyces sp. B-S-A8]|uniref:MFS transporter n=1 Tax=Streptomyces solicavernae TaxID=3043614 RepID=A0ABT6RP93_9ACTN|nr:MFS transporter [Streptomyces sp. B-S-A8]MDI3386233.1 MFS transporter [Streptomyces sp. B-S-A8]
MAAPHVVGPADAHDTGTNPPRTARAWAVTAMVVALMVINFADKAVLGLAAAPIRKEFGLSASEYGAIASSFYLLFSLSAVVVGFLSNRVRTTWILAGLAVLWSLTALPVLLAASVPALYASRIALGAAEGPTAPMAVHAVHKWFPEHARSVPTALVNMGGAVGLAVATPTLVYFITHHGWRSAFVVLAAAGLVWFAAWAFIGREGPLDTYGAGLRGTAHGEARAEPHVSYRRLFLNGTWLGTLAVGIGAYWALALSVAWLPTYLEGALGYSAAEAGNLLIVPHVVSAAVLLAVPWLSGRWMRRGASGRLARGVAGGAVAIAAGLCMLALPHADGGLAVLLMTLAFGLPSAVFPLNFLLGAQVLPVRRRGSVLATSTALVTLAGIAAPAVTGLILDAAGSPDAGFQGAFGVCAALLLAGGALAALTVDPEREARRFGLTS